MGVSYSAYLRVGFIFKYDVLMKAFETRTAEATYRLEDRFDFKTGRKLEPVRILETSAQYQYQIGNEPVEINDRDDAETKIWGALERRLGAEVQRQFDGDVLILVPSDELEYVGEIVDCGNVTFGSHISYKTVVEAAPLVEKIRKGLLQLGLHPDPPLVILDTTIG